MGRGLRPVLARVLTATRRSLPIRTSEDSSGGALLVSEQVLTTYIRHAVAPVPAAAPTRIQIHSDSDHNYTGVTIELTVQFDEPILPIADEIRDRTEQVLRGLLGPIHPPVTVSALHVHVSDVTTDDPHTGRPPVHGLRGDGPALCRVLRASRPDDRPVESSPSASVASTSPIGRVPGLRSGRATTVLSRCERGADENWRRQSEYGPVYTRRIKVGQRDETTSILDQRHARRLLPSRGRASSGRGVDALLDR